MNLVGGGGGGGGGGCGGIWGVGLFGGLEWKGRWCGLENVFREWIGYSGGFDRMG